MKNKKLFNLVLSAWFLALCMVLPFLTGQIKGIIHLPIMLCGLICGWKYGIIIGVIAPLLRSVVFGFPVIFPNAFAMSFELATYGFVVGYLFSHARVKSVKSLYISLLLAMACGRAIWGIVYVCILGIGDNGFTWQIFITNGFINTLPSIILQLILIPVIMTTLGKNHIVEFSES